MLLIALQILFFCLNEVYGSISFGEDYPLQFVPILFSLKPVVYSYTLITATFLHTGFWHLFGNVMFFLAFARTLERLFGTLVFLSAYVFIGALAFIGDWILNPNSLTPIVGSSGAVSFLMGVYLMLFPKSKLRLIITIPPFYKRFWISAYIFLLLWIGLQAYDILTDKGQSGVAYATHIFGFIVGVIAAMAWKEMAPDTDRKLGELMEKEQ
ncbi:rhomboid family intramembrane serine protease [Polynucleobacter sp. AP-RePozz3-80-G7]|uniref:rhomboid family intramembrane serine protease n=1 Tax=Polynucleobacter sp. AP-RePozz3-80-G7 TaxID=2689105 RepID=UPI001C0AFF3B|nr:rhomboid family intramembrane serine protease [Polynucleobacter sp. AP-RePozz3-80-G7]MBU3638194.1 rhomboid family intramembrane serine protease [Polynucleobacter sp. AP-RePozz3-80-G7]